MKPRLLIAALALFVISAATFAAVDQEKEARTIEGMLMAPCCGATTLAMHDSRAAYEMKAEIRQMLASGWTRQQILDHYVEQYGATILAAPPARGFNLVAYVLPLIALLVGPYLIWRTLRRNRPVPEAGAPLPSISAEDRARLERDMRAL